ncbi:MAG: S41 family peptidase [Solirubrobacterales bacterium]
MRYLIAILALVAALFAGIYIGAYPDTPVVGGLKGVIAPDRAEIPVDQVQNLIENDFYRKVPDSKVTNGSISGMIESLNDPYSHYFDPEQNKAFEQSINGSYTGVGVAVLEHKRGLRITTVYDGSPASDASLKKGDVITKVNDKSIAGLSADAAVAKVKGPEGTKVTLTVAEPGAKNPNRLGEERAVTLTRKAIDIPVAEGKLYRRDGQKVGYVSLAQFTANAGRLVLAQVDKLKKQGANAWILDLRGNPGGRLDQAVSVSSIFVPTGMIVATDGRSVTRREYNAIKSDFRTAQPLVVLVDKGSASASEITSGALKYRDRGLIVGTRTFGKGVFQEVTELKNGGAVSLTIGRYELPGKHFITKAGLKPDITVSENPKKSGDEQLSAGFAALAKLAAGDGKQ